MDDLKRNMKISAGLPDLAKTIDAFFKEVLDDDERVCFSLMVWAGHRAQYISNTPREQVKQAMTEVLSRWEDGDDGPLHKAT